MHKEDYYVRRVEFWVSWVIFGNNIMRIQRRSNVFLVREVMRGRGVTVLSWDKTEMSRHSIPLVLYATLILFLMKILPSPIRSHRFLSPTILIFVSSAVSVLALILKQSVPSLPLLSTLNVTNNNNNNTVTVSLYYNFPKSQTNRLQQIQNCLARTVVKAPTESSKK